MDRATADRVPSSVVAADYEYFMHLITHDVRASLRALSSLPEWIREDLEEQATDIPPDVFRHLDMLETHACRADRMLVDLRAFTMAGTGEKGGAPVLLGDALDTALLAGPLPDGFALIRPETDVSLRVPFDDLVQVLAALISNAVKHHDLPTGQIVVTACAAHGTITVSDDGPGIAPQFHEKVFDLLSTLRPRDECEGSGVGLALARKIVMVWGGGIRVVDTGSGRGTTVEISIPAAFEQGPQPG